MTNIKEYTMPRGRFAVIALGTVLALAVSVQATGETSACLVMQMSARVDPI